ncbi:MAG TPA: M56 family metallopeptidase [Thermoanaerobaculia bacterium]|nr:M56 family metallopeptidase [Thermoanaerobaculia bacterium]
MTGHLIVSTILLAAAVAAARFLPFTARTRYAILLAGLVKFAIPTDAFRLIPAETVPSPLRILGGGATRAVAETTSAIEWLPILWAVIALLLFARWLLLRTRTVSAALRDAAPASPREREVVQAARLALGIRTAIDIVRSPICEAPAVIRVIRPMIVLPPNGADDLDDDELRSLILHECAHVARHDNLAALLQALATSILWFHPLVWLASHDLTGAREEACDETVAEAMHGTGSYVSALTKLCHAALAPRTAGVSCMASSRIKERLEHLMSYESIKRRAWSHRVTLMTTAIVIMVSTLAIAGNKTSGGYDLQTRVDRDGDQVVFRFTVTDKATGRVLAQPEVKTAPNEPAVVRFGTEAGGQTTDFRIDARGTHESGSVTFVATANGEVLHRTVHDYKQEHDAKQEKSSTYNGAPISINLKNADLRDVMHTFGQITGFDITVEPGIDAKVTMNVVGMPWDQAFDQIVKQHGLTATIEGKTIRVARNK